MQYEGLLSLTQVRVALKSDFDHLRLLLATPEALDDNRSFEDTLTFLDVVEQSFDNLCNSFCEINGLSTDDVLVHYVQDVPDGGPDDLPF